MVSYTMKQLAEECGVTLRTVQYYEQREILERRVINPKGQKKFSEEDLKKMKNICKLRGVGFTLATINQILGEENPDSVIGSLLEQQKQILCKEIAECQEKLIRLRKMEESIKTKRSIL